MAKGRYAAGNSGWSIRRPPGVSRLPAPPVTTRLFHRRKQQPRRDIVAQGGDDGISPKMLSQTLRQHERDGLIDRAVTPGPQIEVTYTITELGRTLLLALRPLIGWAEGHMQTVRAKQHRYDTLR